MSSRAKLAPSVSSNMSGVLVELKCRVVVSSLSPAVVVAAVGRWGGFYIVRSVLYINYVLITSNHDNCPYPLLLPSRLSVVY